MPTSSAPPANSRPILLNVPLRSPEFVGRENDVDEIVGHLAAGHSVNLWASGGRGKSELAFAVAERMRALHLDCCADGQIYVDLLGHGFIEPLGPDATLRWILRALPNIRTRFETLKETALAAEAKSLLHQKRLLIVIDNARNLAQLDQVLGLELPIALLVTSRSPLTSEKLAISKELHPLDTKTSVTILRRSSGLEDSRLLAEVADRCRCSPLALGLAARSLKRFRRHPAEYVALLDSSPFNAPEGDAADRETARLNSVIWASFTLLPAPMQRRWLHLSIFPASFTAEAVAHLWGGSSTTSAASDLASLSREHALVVPWRAQQGDIELRYRLHDLSRDFGLSYFQHDPKFRSASIRHAVYYADLFLKNTVLLESDSAAASRLIDTESTNLEAARPTLAESGMSNPEHAKKYCLVYARWRVFIDRQDPIARDVWTIPAPKLARKLPVDDENRLLRAQINNRRGVVLAFQGKFENSYRRFRIAKSLVGQMAKLKEIRQREQLEEELEWQIAWHWMNINKHEEAVSILIPLIPRLAGGLLDAPRFKRLLETRDALAGAYLTLKRPKDAEELLAGTFSLIRDASVPIDIWSIISPITVMGCMYADLAAADKTRTVLGDIGCSLCKLAYDLCVAHGRPWGLAVLSQRLGSAYLQLGQPVTAESWFRNAEFFAKQWGLTVSEAQAKDGIAQAESYLQSEPEAVRTMKELLLFKVARSRWCLETFRSLLRL